MASHGKETSAAPRNAVPRAKRPASTGQLDRKRSRKLFASGSIHHAGIVQRIDTHSDLLPPGINPRQVRETGWQQQVIQEKYRLAIGSAAVKQVFAICSQI
jgi:hypothetical protein